MSRPFKLYRLQQIDSLLDGLRSRLTEVEKALLDDHDVRAIEEKRIQIENELNKIKKLLRDAEYQTQQQRIKIEQTEASLYGGKVRNPKELQDLQHESAALKRHLAVLEERLFNVMLEEEQVAAQYEECQSEQAEVNQRQAERIKALLQEKVKLERDMDRSEGERQAALSSIETQDLDFYTRLRLKKKGIAVAKVTDKACTACGSILSATLLNAAYSPNQINQCETCGRILYTG